MINANHVQELSYRVRSKWGIEENAPTFHKLMCKVAAKHSKVY